jgi:type I restriction enzyme S subunit
MQKEKRLIPELRFVGFEKEWQNKFFSEMLLSSRLGGNYSNSEIPNDYPLIKMGNLGRGSIKLDKLEYIDEKEELKSEDLIKEGDLFFNTRNTLDLVGKVAIWRNELPKAYYNSNLMYIKFENNYFMNYSLNSFQGIKKLRRIATGTTSVAAIYSKDLFKLKFNIPSLEEQQKIANFLTTIDTQIQTLEKKKSLLEQYKKGLMQKLFKQELRFKDEDGNVFPEWENIKLGLFIKEYKNKNKIRDEFEVFTSSNKGLMFQSNYYGYNRLTDRDNTGFNIIPEGYITYRSRSDNRKFTFNLNSLGVTGLISVYYPVFKSINGNSKFLIELLNFNQNYIGKFSVGTSQTVLSFNELAKIKFSLPCPEEQIKIANFLSAIDENIALVNTKIEQTKAYKKGLLQQMFV